ncbi:flagellar hook protein FlgE [Acetatifactor aquisgranensis]|uniref:flagellar hook protein FlgE n=1 Tax=Acetatifactor aquisgranensis TaxID=2941233 RepID=UPI00203EBF88|nr:flagellar hook-basal body complex protein [Acetatifactor aquisgranensis]
MMRSLFSGVSGLKTHQTRMDVIGNNIANVNTVAYKYSTMTFASLMSQTTQRASGANATTGTGGVNARQIGLGVKTSAININITAQGASQSTGNPFDIMITGENFFVVSDGKQNYFTRDGSFYVDGAGNLAMTSIGYNVMGWQPDIDPETGDVRGIKKDTVSALRIMSSANMTYPPEATSEAYMSGIIDLNDTDVTSDGGKVVNLNFYDSLGYTYTAKFSFKQDPGTPAGPNGTPAAVPGDQYKYTMSLVELQDSTGKKVPANAADEAAYTKIMQSIMADRTVIFDKKTGKIASLAEGTNTPITNLNDMHFNLNLDVLNDTANPPATATDAGNFQKINLDISQLTTFDNKGTSTAGATNGKDDKYNTGSGRRVGAMIGVAIQQNGEIYASYDNGMTKLLGQIATARFANASGLEKQADNLYSATLNSGAFDGIGVDITADGGYMSTGQLEMSNVDLSSEFTEMITTQRGFQANSRIITVSDTLLEELTNLKR